MPTSSKTKSRTNQTSIGGPTVKLAHVRFFTPLDVNIGCPNLDEKSSFLKTFADKCGRFRYARLPFGVTLVGDMFQRKIDEIFKEVQNIFGI